MYLLYTTSFATLEEVKNFKSMQSYKYFTAGWVIQHKWKSFKDACVVVGKVNHSYAASSTPLRPWVIIRNNGVVTCGHCTCMAGLGETCSHVGALLYWIEYQVRKREEVSCTSRSNTWLEPPTMTSIPYQLLEEMDFTSAERKMTVFQGTPTTTPEQPGPSTPEQPGPSTPEQPGPSSNAPSQLHPTKAEMTELFIKCSSSTVVPILFAIKDAPFHEKFLQSSDHLPLPLQSLYDPENLNCNYTKLLEIGEGLEGIMDITLAQQCHLEEITHSQANSKVWMRFRSGRITASRFHQAVHTDPHKPALSLVRAICYPNTVRFTTAATKYGCDHEKDAIQAYKLKVFKLHQDLKVSPAGLVVSVKKACFGASPDSFLECTCCGKGVLEVKCPYCARACSLDQIDSRNFCLLATDENDSEMMLKRNHPYFYQCQLQMMVTERLYCDFVVWTPAGELHVERLFPDEEFLLSRLLQAEKFFHLAIIPELLGKWFTRQHVVSSVNTDVLDDDSDDDGTWCYCKQPRGGAMIGCDKRGCEIKWFHMECVKMTEVPRREWTCPTCHAAAKGRKKVHK